MGVQKYIWAFSAWFYSHPFCTHESFHMIYETLLFLRKELGDLPKGCHSLLIKSGDYALDLADVKCVWRDQKMKISVLRCFVFGTRWLLWNVHACAHTQTCIHVLVRFSNLSEFSKVSVFNYTEYLLCSFSFIYWIHIGMLLVFQVSTRTLLTLAAMHPNLKG